MRIPSQFNDDTLYGRRGKRPDSSQAYRRMFRLSVALVLVVVVMGQAAQPRVWQLFFGDPEAEAIEADAGFVAVVNANAPQSSMSLETTGRADPASNTAQTTKPIDEGVLKAARALTRQQSVNEQRQWTVVLDRWQSGESFPLMRSVVPGVISQIEKMPELTENEVTEWSSMLERFDDKFGNGGIVVAAEQSGQSADSSDAETSKKTAPVEPGMLAADAERLNAWLSALDKAAVERVIDGSVWRSQDIDAFYRQLDQVHTLSPRGAVAVSVVPLMQQPKVYLGSKVRVSGKVASAEKKVAAANPFGVTDYWELWIKPNDGGDRPMVLILPDVPQKIKDIQTLGTVSKGPGVSVVGRFFKRLAYPSGIGADAAPVVLGRVLGFGTQATANATANGGAEKAVDGDMTRRLWLTIAAALLLGLGIAAAVMWRTSVMAKQSRELRTKRKTTVDFPDALTEREPKI